MNDGANKPSPISAKPLVALITAAREGSYALWLSAWLMALGAVICWNLMLVAHRPFAATELWDKPAKFFFSVAIQFAAISLALSFLPEVQRRGRSIRLAVAAIIGIGCIELAYVVLRFLLPESSHFEDNQVLALLRYAVTALGALTIAVTALFIAIRGWGQRGQGLVAKATGLGFVLAVVLVMSAHLSMSLQTGL